MTRQPIRARILPFPYGDSLVGARLDTLHEEDPDGRHELVMDYHELRLSAPPTLIRCDGRPCEQVQGLSLPRRLRFIGVQPLKRTGVFLDPGAVPLAHRSRSFTGVLHWRNSDGDILFLFWIRSDEPSTLIFSAQQCVSEERSGPVEETAFTRDWSPPPLNPARLITAPTRSHQLYSGDPITIRLDARRFRQRLFIGGLEEQDANRPAVDAVLNLSEEPSRWAVTTGPSSTDRWVTKGEGRYGMSATEIAVEAQWVIERLRTGQRVLVHCSAGMNRSATVCCAVLMLLEGLSAEAALERVHAHHPWARPDPYHWFALRWLMTDRLSRMSSA